MRTKTRWMALAVLLLAVLLMGCTSNPQPTDTATQTGTTEQNAAKAPEKQAPREAHVTVPAGTALDIRLVEGIDTGRTQAGAAFEGTMASSLVVSGVEVAPVGSTVTGKVTHVVSAGRLNRPAELSLVLTSLTSKGGAKHAISTNTLSMKGQSHKKRNVEMIGGGAGAGALIGALTGGKKGAAIGAAIGGGGGTGVAMATGKKEIVLQPEDRLTFTLSSPVTVVRR